MMSESDQRADLKFVVTDTLLLRNEAVISADPLLLRAASAVHRSQGILSPRLPARIPFRGTILIWVVPTPPWTKATLTLPPRSVTTHSHTTTRATKLPGQQCIHLRLAWTPQCESHCSNFQIRARLLKKILVRMSTYSVAFILTAQLFKRFL
jgi:hypothetical protein